MIILSPYRNKLTPFLHQLLMFTTAHIARPIMQRRRPGIATPTPTPNGITSPDTPWSLGSPPAIPGTQLPIDLPYPHHPGDQAPRHPPADEPV